MAEPKSLLQMIRELREREESERLATAITRDDWLGELHTLMHSIQIWLRPASSEGLAFVEPIHVHLSEEPVGEYDAPGLKITLPGARVVWVRPGGVLSVGAKGWVDM